MKRWPLSLVLLGPLWLGSYSHPAFAADLPWRVGVAKIDITPDYPVRLSGYAVRRAESQGIAQHLWAKALAIGRNRGDVALLITVDNCGVPRNVRDTVAAGLKRQDHVPGERLAICSTHTHSAPWLTGYLPNLFSGPIPPEEQAHVELYTQELTGALLRVARQALADRRPARIGRGQGEAGFAANRRTKAGPADHDLPALFVTDATGQLRAILSSYACHCTTLTGESNVVCGDWAGYAEEFLERDHPGAVALLALGCAGDANPNPRPGLEWAKQHGHEIATSVDRILTNALTPVEGRLVCRAKQIELPFDTLPTRSEWEARAQETNAVGAHARLNLARLDRGERLPAQLEYLVQTWVFGDRFAMVFLPGEVVVDYSLRLKREFDRTRLWINAYANDVPAYIPSERILQEGGYEGGGAMVYYDHPTRFAPGVEERIVSAVHELLPRGLLSH